MNIPVAMYRLQLNGNLPFRKATALVDYLHDLGISHCYLSPMLKAKEGSTHGYDIVDHSQLNAEIGTEQEFNSFVTALRKQKMGVICDIVPNHMYIADPLNLWWFDVLENGPSSRYADYFDIDWHPPRLELVNKVLLPLLDQQYGEALENQDLKVIYREGAFFVELPRGLLPTDPSTWNLILERVEKEVQQILTEDDQQLLELKSIITALSHLPLSTDLAKEKMEERQREKEVIKRRIDTMITQCKPIAEHIASNLRILNGTKGDSRSFDWMESFLKEQPYRLCFWRVANDEINYRRFFDIFEFAGLRTEKSEVFDAIHAFIFDLVNKGLIDGLRIDHIDGLWDPEQYLNDLQQRCKQNSLFFVIVEKILLGNEKLIKEWPVQGTVGYDFLNQLNGIFVVQQNKNDMEGIYRNFTGFSQSPLELSYNSKMLILNTSMSSELYVLARYLDRISEHHRSSRDFTSESLRAALRDVIACFPVYRSYIHGEGKIHDEDRHYILMAIARAKRFNATTNVSIFDFIQQVLLLEHPSGLDEDQKRERKKFVMRFQQLTPPVMGKGLEDTAFYRYYPLASLNEVGADLYGFGRSVDAFHKKNIERLETWPYSVLETSTHDTKRSEDVRARINVLSEIPNEWKDALLRWSHRNQPYKINEEDEVIPDANEEYLLYQTLIGTWPLSPADNYVNRIQAYMEKAIREAKVNTSWINPNKLHEERVQQFIQKVLSPDSPFISDFKQFVPKIISAGMLNSLSQVLLKLTSPGVPEIYQGSEIWDFSLVDPDNRRPVDFEMRRSLLKGIKKNSIQQMLQHPEDGQIKLFITRKTLEVRHQLVKLFSHGSYIPLAVEGDKQNHVIAFARLFEKKAVVVVSSRFFIPLMEDTIPVIPANTWKNTRIILPPELAIGQFQNHFSDKEFSVDKHSIDLEKLFDPLPFALLES